MIRWRKQDKTKLSRYISKFNASITRLSRKNPELADAGILPEKLDINVVKYHISTRRDYNRIIQRIDRWFRPKARDIILTPAGTRTTRWEVQEARYSQQRINAQRKKVRSKFNVGERVSEQSNLQDISVADKWNNIRSNLAGGDDIENQQQSWKNFVHNLFIQESDNYNVMRLQNYYDNWISALYENFSVLNAQAIQNFIEERDISPAQLFEMVIKDERLSIAFVYSEEEEEQLAPFILTTLDTMYREMVKAGEVVV